MVLAEKGLQGEVSKYEGTSYSSEKCGNFTTGSRSSRRSVTEVRDVFVHEDMQGLPLGGDVESVFVLPQTILFPLYLPIFPSFYSTFPIKQPIQGIFVIL
jgi:hypothetical protein